MASYSLYSALLLTGTHMALVKSSVLQRKQGAIWDAPLAVKLENSAFQSLPNF
jgi:hypothetical protein